MVFQSDGKASVSWQKLCIGRPQGGDKVQDTLLQA